jgi:hypothetical protein
MSTFLMITLTGCGGELSGEMDASFADVAPDAHDGGAATDVFACQFCNTEYGCLDAMPEDDAFG